MIGMKLNFCTILGIMYMWALSESFNTEWVLIHALGNQKMKRNNSIIRIAILKFMIKALLKKREISNQELRIRILGESIGWIFQQNLYLKTWFMEFLEIIRLTKDINLMLMHMKIPKQNLYSRWMIFDARNS